MNKRDAVFFSMGPIVTALISFLSIPLIAWVFEQEDVGRNNMYVIFVSLAMTLTLLGLDQAYGREYYEVEDKSRLLSSCVIPVFLTLLIFVAIVTVYAKELAVFFFDSVDVYFVHLASVCVVLTVFTRFCQTMLRMSGRALLFSIGQAWPKLVFLLCLLWVILAGSKVDFIDILYFYLWGLLSLSMVLLIFTWNSWRKCFSEKIDFLRMCNNLRFGMPLLGASLMFWMLSSTSLLVLKANSSLAEVAVYSVAMGFAGVAVLVQSVVSVIWLPLIYKENTLDKRLQIFDSSVDMVLVVVVLMFFICAAFSWLIRFVLPGEYMEVEILLVVCMLQPAFYLLSEMTVIGINIARKTSYGLYSALLAFVVNIGLCVYLIPKFGAAGASLANAIGFFVFFVARTELSVLVWRGFQRRGLYYTTFSMLVLSSGGLLLFEYHKNLLPMFWTVSMLVVIYLLRNRLKKLISFGKNFVTGK